MGHAARARKAAEVRVMLDRGDYWELRAISRDIEALQFDLLKFRDAKNEEIRRALIRRNEFFDKLAKANGKIDVKMGYRFEDKTCTLIESGPAVRADTTEPKAPKASKVEKPEPKAPPRPAVLGKDKKRAAVPSTRVH